MSRPNRIRIGTRASTLALWQARAAQAALRERHPDIEFELVEISSHGDGDRETPLIRMGTVGIFTKRLEEALLRNEIDVAVHSLKDMPTALPPGLALAAFLPREDPRDALVSRGETRISALRHGAVVATGSIRRRAQISALRPDIRFEEVRGNIETRLRKFRESEWDATILACAGLRRLGLQEHIAAPLEPDEILHAVGQGIMTVECREGDSATAGLLHGINDAPAEAAALAERALLRRLEGGCQVPIGAHAQLRTEGTAGGELTLEAAVVSLDGSRAVRDRLSAAVPAAPPGPAGAGAAGGTSAGSVGPAAAAGGAGRAVGADSAGARHDQAAAAAAEELGRALADRLLERGAEPILAEIRHTRSEP